MNNKLFKALLILVVLCLVLVTALFACSPRDKYPDDVVIKPGQTGNETTDVYKQTNYTFNESLERLKTITENASRFNSYSDTSEWFIIDTRIDYYFRDFEVVPNHIIDFTLVIKANINLLDNAKSELFFEYIDNQLPSSESLRFGVYYIAKAMYVDIAGEKFYADEVNLTEAGKLIVAPLSAMGLDVYSLVYGFVAGSTGIDMLDGILPLAKLVSGNDEGYVIERQIIDKYSDSLEYEYALRLNPVLALLNSSLGSMISWDAFGLPDLDPLLTKVFGFGLSTLKTKAWPRMAAKIIFHSAKEDIPVLDDDGNFTYDAQDNLITEKGYVFNGMTITIDTPVTASQKKDFYDLSLQVMPLRLGLADKKTAINFSNYSLGDAYKGTVYQKASLFNLEADFSLIVDAEENGKLTLNDVLGSMVDLGGIGDIPLNFPEQATSYEFGLNIQAHLDIFDYTGTKLQATITFQGQPFLKMYFEGETMYINCSDLKDTTGQIIPNIKVSGLNVNELLSGLLSSLNNILDPNYKEPVDEAINAPSNAEGEEESSGFDIMSILTIVSANIINYSGPNGEEMIAINFSNAAINELLAMFMGAGGGELGINHIILSLDKGNIFNSIKLNIGLSDTVSARLNINKIAYFREPAFENYEMVDEPAEQALYLDVMDETLKYYSVTLSGQFEMGMNETTGGINLDGLMNALLGNVLLNIGVTESASVQIGYIVKASIDIYDITNSGISINFYVDETTNVFLMLYYDAADDTIYIDLANFGALQEKMPGLNLIGTLPGLKINNTGIRDLLTSISFFNTAEETGSNLALAPSTGYNVSTPANFIADLFSGFFLGVNMSYAAALNAEGEEPEGGFDIMALLGQAISINVNDDIKALIVNIDRQILTLLMGMLGVMSPMPEVEAYLKLQLIGVRELGEDDGYLSVYFAILDSVINDNGQYDRALYVDLQLIRSIKVTIGDKKPEFFIIPFVPDEFVLLEDFLADLKIGFEASGTFDMSSDEASYTNDFINGMLAGLIEGLSLRFGLDGFAIRLKYDLKANIAYSDIIALFAFINGTGALPEALASELSLTLTDMESGDEVLGLYLIGNNIYLNLDYFGMPSIYISDSSLLISEIIELFSSSEEIDNPAAASPLNAAGNYPAMVSLQIWLAPDKVSLTLTKDVIAALLGLFIEGDLPVQFKDTAVEIDLSDGVRFSLVTGVEVLNLEIKLNKVGISVLKQELPVIALPQGVEFYGSEDGGMPEVIYIKAEGEFSLRAEPDNENGQLVNKALNLSPALQSLFGSVDLTAYLEMIGFVDGRLYFTLEAAINMLNTGDSTVKVLLSTSDGDSQRTVILSVFYDKGDLYIDTQIFNIGKLYIKDVDKVFTQLMAAMSSNKENGSAPANSPANELGNFVDIMFVKGGITVQVLKSTLLTVFSSLGVDLAPYFAGIISMTVTAGISINPVSIDLSIDVDGVQVGLRLGNVELKFDETIELPSTEGYTTIEELETLSVRINGRFSFEIFGSDEGDRFDFIVQNIRDMLIAAQNQKIANGEMDPAAAIDYESLLNLGILLQVIDDKFGGTVYYTIDAHIDLLNLNNLNLSLRLSSTLDVFNSNIEEELGDILSFFIVSEDGKLNAYLDADSLGLEKIKIKDIAGLISTFTSTGATPLEMPKNASSGTVSPANVLAANILLSITTNPDYQYHNAKAPILLNVTEGAFFALFSMLGIDISQYVGEYLPNAQVKIGAEGELLSVSLGLQNLLGISFTIENPTLQVNGNIDMYRAVAEDPSFYLINKDSDKLLVKLSFKGTFTFNAEDTDEDSAVDFQKIIGLFFKEAQFSVLLENLGYGGKIIEFDVQIKLNIPDLLKGTSGLATGLEALIMLTLKNGPSDPGQSMSIYIKNGNAYADFSILNVGKMKVMNVLDLFSQGGGGLASQLIENASPLSAPAYASAEQLAASFVTLTLGNNSGLVLSAMTDVFVVILNALSQSPSMINEFGEKMGDIVADTVNNNLAINVGIGSGSFLNIDIEVANYALSFEFNSISILFKNSDVIFWGFDESHYELIPKELEYLHVEANINFGVTLNEGAEYSFEELLSGLLGGIGGLTIEPILSVLSEISNQFRIDIEANLNLASLMDGEQSVDKRVKDSDLSVVLYDVSGSTPRYVLSIYYVAGDLYLDAECFNIQKVKIVGAFDYFISLYNMLTGLSGTLGNNVPGAPANAAAFNSADVNAVAAYINIMVCPEGLVANLGSAALFAIVGMLGLDISNYVEPVGVIDVTAKLLTPTQLVALDIKFLSYLFDADGNRVQDVYGDYITSGDYMEVNLAFNNNFKLSLKVNEEDVISAPINYLEINNQVPIIGISTKIYFELSAKEATFENLNQEPLSSILSQLLGSFMLSSNQGLLDDIKNILINYNIGDDMKARFELDILVNLNITNIQALEAQVIINKVGDGYSEKLIQLNIYDGDLYVDLTRIGGPRFCVIETMETILGSKGFNEDRSGEDDEDGPSNAGDGGASSQSLFLDIQIKETGLFIYAYKTAFDVILNMFNLQNIAMFQYVEAKVFVTSEQSAPPISLGLEFSVGTETTPDVMKIGLGLQGFRINFQAFSREELIIPQSSSYIQAHNINTIIAEASLEVKVQSDKGTIDLSALYLALFGDSPLATTLPQKFLLDDLGDTLVIDIKAIVNISDLSKLLDSLQLQVTVYSKKAPDKFGLVITYYKNSIYIDASKIGLSKIMFEDISGLFEYFMALASGTPTEDEAELSNALARYADTLRTLETIEQMTPMNEEEQLACKIMLMLSADEGFFILAAKDLINVAFKLLGLDISSYIDGVIEPEVKIGIDPELSVNIGIALKSALADNLGALSLNLSFVTSKLRIDVADEVFIETPAGIESSILPIISKEERALYTNYDKLTVYADINISLSAELKDGRISAEGTTGAIFAILGLTSALETDIVFSGGYETLRVDIAGSIGIDFSKLLSRDWTQVKAATSAYLQLSYTILDHDGNVYHTQPLATLYLTDDIIYLTLEVMDSDINIRIADVNLSRVFTDLFGVTPGEEDEEEEEEQPENAGAINNIENSLKMFGMLGGPSMATVESVINLNTSGFYLIISKELLIAIMDELGGLLGAAQDSYEESSGGLGFDLSKIDFEGIFNEILDGLQFGFYFDGEDGGFSIRLNIFKEQEDREGDSGASYPSAGYDLELSLLHGTHIATTRDEYEAFDNYLRDDPDLKAFYDTCFDSRDVEWRFTVGLDLVLGAEFMAYLLDWSRLFALEETETAFYLQVLENLQGNITMSITVDMLFKELNNLMLDAMIRFINEDGDEVMALYFLGSLHQSNYSYKGADPQLYLTIPGMGIEGITLNADVFQEFLGLNLKAFFDSIHTDPVEEEEEEIAPQNEGEDDPIIDEEEGGLGREWWASLLDSIVISKGQIAILVAKTALQDILTELLNFPFDDIGRFALTLDNVANILRLDFSLDNQPEIDVDKIGAGSLETMVYEGKSWPVAINTVDPYFPVLTSGNIVSSYSFTDKFGRPAYFVLLKDVTAAEFSSYIALFGDTAVRDATVIDATMYTFTNGTSARGALVRYNNDMVTLVFAEESEFTSGRNYVLADIEIGAVSQMTPIGDQWPAEQIAALDNTIPVYEGSLMQAYAYFDKDYNRDVVCMLFNNVTEKLMKEYVNLIRDQGYQMTRDSEGVYKLSKSCINYTLDENGKKVGETAINIIIAVMLFDNGTMCFAVSDTKNKFNFSLSIENIDVMLGANNIFYNHFDPQEIDYQTYFEENFKPLTAYKWEFEVYSELTIDDSLGGFFDLTETTSSLFNMLNLGSFAKVNFALQPSEDIHIVIGFALRVFIDFSELSKMRVQLAITYNGKQIILISYIGNIEDGEENATVYADLSGLSLPAINIKNIQLATLVKDLMESIDFSSPEEQPAEEEAAGPLNAHSVLPAEDRIDLSEIAYGNPLLLFTASSKKVSLAITGALAYSLIAGIDGLGFKLPHFNNLEIGYSEEEGLAGLIIRLTDDTPYDQAFRIAYNFTKGESTFGTAVESEINPFKNAAGGTIVYEDISVISKIGLSLDLEMRMRTKKNDGNKSEQLEGLEALIEALIGMEPNAMNLEPQDSILVFGVSLKIYTNLANLSETTMMISLSFNEESFMAIYYFAEKNLVYADLNGLGLFRAAISGVDLMSILGVLLGGIVTPGEGLKLLDLIAPSGETADSGTSAPDTGNTDTSGETGGTGSSGGTTKPNYGVSDLLNSTDAPIIRILLGNEEITIQPNAAVLGTLVTGINIPQLADIRLSTNLSYGLNNMNFRVKIDNMGNSLSFNVAENMFLFSIGSAAESDVYKTPSSLVSGNKYGGLTGITLNAGADGGINANFDIVALICTLEDTIKMSDLTIYLDKRADYWYMRDLRWGVPEFATGPFHFGADGAGYNERVAALSFDIFGFEIKLLDTFVPQYFNNAFRRTRLTLDKTRTNMIDIRITQLTQVLGVTTDFEDTSDWIPMSAKAFIKDNILKISLGSALVIDLTPIIERLTSMVIEAVMRAFGLTPPLSSIAADLVSGIVSPLIASLIGDLTGYGNPLRLGEIIDSLMGGGIEVFRVFLPEMLAEDDESDPYAFGSFYGTITDKSGLPISGATVSVADGKFIAVTDEDGRYSFVNLPVGTYKVVITCNGYNTYPLPGETEKRVTVASYALSPAYEYSVSLDDYLLESFINVIITGVVKDTSGNPITNVKVYFDNDLYSATTNASGVYTLAIPGTVYGRNHTMRYESNYVSFIITASNRTYTVNFIATLPTTGTIMGRLVVLEDKTLITSSDFNAIVSGANTQDIEIWRANVLNLDSALSLPEAATTSAYYDAVSGTYYAVLTGVSAETFENYRNIISGPGGYSLKQENNVYHALKTNKRVIFETRRLGSVNTVMVAVKACALLPVDTDVEIWLERGGKTIFQADSFSGGVKDGLLSSFGEGKERALAKVTPRDYIIEGNKNKESNISSGLFNIYDLDFSVAYTVKIRSKVYKNFDVTVAQMTNRSATVNMGNIILTVRDKHWSSETEAASSMIQGVRLRLGADILDANGDGTKDDSTDPGYASDGIPQTMYSWLNEMGEDVANKLINSVPGLLGSLVGNSALKFLIEQGGGFLTDLLNLDANENYVDIKGKPIFIPETNYIDGYEGGATDNSNNISYVELWLNSDVFTGLFNMVYGFLIPMIGMSAISEDQRFMIPDLAAPPAGTSSDNIKLFQYVGEFDETDDIKIYDYVYQDKAAYINAIRGAAAKIPAGLISFAINLATRSVAFLQNKYVRMVIQYAATALIDEQLDQVSRLISHLLPFSYPYSMAYEKDLAGSPLQSTDVSSTLSAGVTTNVKDLVENEGILDIGDKTNTKNTVGIKKVNDDGELLDGYLREVNFYDLATYVKVVLNNNVETILDRIVLFINGASYEGSTNGVVDPNIGYKPMATILRADTVKYNADGSVMAESVEINQIIQAWIKKNTANSYLVIDDYRYTTDDFGVTTRVLIAKTYVRDVYGCFDKKDWQFGDDIITDENQRKANAILSAKDDHYQEIDINNTGLRLRVVKELLSTKFFNAKDTGSGPIERTTMTPPDKIVFHDPYNPKDFTAWGGTWAVNEGGIRHNLNKDGTYTVESVLDILPNRNEVAFNDGDSSDSTGAYVYWDMTDVKFVPTTNDKSSYIVGYCANAVYGKNAANMITKILAVVEGKMVVDPTSTLKLNAQGTAEVANSLPVLALPEIDPLDFDKAAYMAALPKQFTASFKVQYPVDGIAQTFTVYGGETDYIYKRYVFNDLKWELDEKQLSFTGGTAYAKLTYSYNVYLHGDIPKNDSEEITINVPINVINRKWVSVSAPVANSVAGIVNNELTFNPLIHSNLKETMEGVTALNVLTEANDLVTGWTVSAVNAESLNDYDPKAIEHPEYKVYYTLTDDFGLSQTVPVTVHILSRKIVSSSLDDIGTLETGDAVKTTRITPFNNTGLNLPGTITVIYQGSVGGVSLIEVLHEHEDYEWSVPSMSYTFGTQDTTKIYTVTANVGSGDYAQQLYLYYKVEQRIPKSVKNIVVQPYGDTSVSNTQQVVFNNGVSDLSAAPTKVYYIFDESSAADPFTYTTVNIKGNTYKKDIVFDLPTFEGRFYYADVVLYDELFGLAVVKNVSIAVRVSPISSINKPDGATVNINQYYSDEGINAFLSMSGLTASIFKTEGKADDSFFDIIGWEYLDEGGLFADKTNAYIKVIVGNEGYATSPIWKQEVRVDLSPYLEDLTVASLAEDTLYINDPYEFTLPQTAEVVYRDGGVTASTTVPAVYNLGVDSDDFYKYNELTGYVTVGSMSNNMRTFPVRFVNNNPRTYSEIKFYNDAECTDEFISDGTATFYAFDNITLPKYAEITFADNEKKVFNAYWSKIDEYGIEGGAVTATAMIGDPVFGYIKKDISFTVIGESLTSYVAGYRLPDRVYLNPYLDFDTQIEVSAPRTIYINTTKRNNVAVTVKYPAIPFSYQEEIEHGLYFEVGITTDFGSVGNIKTGQTEHFGYEIRQPVYSRFVVESRVAIGIEDALTGSIYEKIDFNEYAETKVLFTNGREETMAIDWDLSNLEYSFLGGTFNIVATLKKGIPGLEQSFNVLVNVRPSNLIGIAACGADENNPILTLDNTVVANLIKELKVDPFVGFVGLPTKVKAKFLNVDELVEVNVSWSYQRIVEAMPLSGMRFDETNNLAAIATIYSLDEQGNRTAMQSVEVPVESIDRSIINTLVSKSMTEDDFTPLTEQFDINPYDRAYSEEFASENFAYFRRVKLMVKDEAEGAIELIFNLNANSYIIRDRDTGRKTDLNNLYTGRNVSIAMSFAPAGTSVSRQTRITRNLLATILDMTYESGLAEAYYIDVYGIKTNGASPYYDAKYAEKVTYTDELKTLTTASGTTYSFNVVFDNTDVNTAFDSFDKKIGAIDYKAGTGRLYANFGNDYAGYQKVIIPVYYDDRTVTTLFDENAPGIKYGTFVSATGVERKGFIFDPFAAYSVNTNYPAASSAVRFATADGIVGAYDNNNATSKIKVVWDDNKVEITYKGSEDGYVKATVSAQDGSAAQTLAYRVKVLNRTVASYSNVLKPNYATSLLPYDFNNEPDLAKALAAQIFVAEGSTFTVSFTEGNPISFKIGADAKYYSAADSVTLLPEEEEIKMIFNLDMSRPLAYKGKNARFFVTIPGFGMGAEGQQTAAFEIPCEEQYIIDVEFYSEKLSQYLSYINWLKAEYPTVSDDVIARNESYAAAGNRYVYDISDPYFFIKLGGVPMADVVRVKVGSQSGIVTGTSTKTYDGIEAFWSSARANKVNIYYNKEMISSSFQMELDNQSFKVTFNVTPYIVDNNLLFNENNAYGEEEIILLPGNSAKVSGAPLVISKYAVDNDTYTVTFSNGQSSTFIGIAGGGSYIKNYNMWSFDDIDFGSTLRQYATLTLGGRGGQEILWGFLVSSKKVVNYSIPSVYTLKVGNSVTLPTSVKQLFSGSTYASSKDIPIIYGDFKNSEAELNTRTHGFTVNGRTITASKMTPARSVYNANPQDGDSEYPRDDNYAVGYIEWQPTLSRAYPSPKEELGGKIFFVGYNSPNDGKDNLSLFPAYLHNPDATYNNSVLKPGMNSDWQYPSDLGIAGTASTSSTDYILPQMPYSRTLSGSKQNSVPVIKLAENAMFSSLNLPVVALTWSRNSWKSGGFLGIGEKTYPALRVDQIFTIPWEKATVYWTSQPNNTSQWNHGAGFYGTDINTSSNPDIYYINTGKDTSGNSRRNGRYTIVAPMDLGTVTYNFIVAIDIVEIV